MAKNGHNFKSVAEFEVRSFANVLEIYWSRLYKKTLSHPATGSSLYQSDNLGMQYDEENCLW